MAEAPAQTRTVDRALDLLVVVAEAGELTLAQAARDADLPASTALRLLRSLEGHELVRRDSRGVFRPGRRLVTLAVSTLRRQNVVHLAKVHLDELTAVTGESAYLAAAGPGQTAVYLRATDSPRAIRHVSWVGHTVPLDGSAIGAALRGQVGDDGYVAVRAGIEPDVTAVAAPVEVAGLIVGGLSVLGPSYRISDADLIRFGRAVVKHARALSDELGEARSSA